MSKSTLTSLRAWSDRTEDRDDVVLSRLVRSNVGSVGRVFVARNCFHDGGPGLRNWYRSCGCCCFRGFRVGVARYLCEVSATSGQNSSRLDLAMISRLPGVSQASKITVVTVMTAVTAIGIALGPRPGSEIRGRLHQKPQHHYLYTQINASELKSSSNSSLTGSFF